MKRIKRCPAWLLVSVTLVGAGALDLGTAAASAQNASISVQPGTGKPAITARPNPIPGGPGFGTATMTWDAADDTPGIMCVAVDARPEQIFAAGAKGAQDAPWIGAPTTEDTPLPVWAMVILCGWLVGLTTYLARASYVAARIPATIYALIPAVAVIAAGVLVNWRVVPYPFIQDDWHSFARIAFESPGGFVSSEISPFGKVLYRPLGSVWFLVAFYLFDLNATMLHMAALIIHLASSLLVVRIIRIVTGDSVIAWATGVLYATAASVHMEPLLWASGVYDVAGMFLFLLSLLLFLSGRPLSSALVYAAALALKESAVPCLVVFAADAVLRRKTIRSTQRVTAAVRDVWLHGAFVACFLFLKRLGVPQRAIPSTHPYKISVIGPHVWEHVVLYSRWIIEAVAPLWDVSGAAAVWSCVAVLAAAAAARYVSRTTRTHDSELLLLTWAIAGLAPVMFLPNHAYRYYLTLPLPAILALLLSTCARLARPLWRRGSVFVAVIAAGAGASAAASMLYFQQIDRRGLQQSHIDGTNALVQRAHTVRIVQDGLLSLHPSLPPGAILLFKHVDVWAFHKDDGPRLWYGDSSLRVYDARFLRKGPQGPYLEKPPETQTEAYTGGTRDVPLGNDPIFLFRLEEGQLHETTFAREELRAD
jgi:hypothetical protein